MNLGCGDRYADGWVNVDLGTTPQRVDQVVDLLQPLPWPEASVTHVYAGHVFEHITIEECEDVLERLLPCVTPGGPLMIVGPDVEVAQRMIDEGASLATMWGATMDSLRFGAGRWAGDVHRWEWTSGVMAALVGAAGWRNVGELHIEDVPPFWPVADRRPQWQRAVQCVSPR
jgi:hypothetical protein